MRTILRSLPIRLRARALAESVVLAHGPQQTELALELLDLAVRSEPGPEPQTGRSGLAPFVRMLGKAVHDRWNQNFVRDEAILGLFAAVPSLDPEIRHAAAVAMRDRLASVVQASGRPAAGAWAVAPAQIAAAVEAIPAMGLARSAAELLGHESRDVRVTADRALMRMAVKAWLDGVSGGPRIEGLATDAALGAELAELSRDLDAAGAADAEAGPAEWAGLCGAVAEAARGFPEHRRRGPLIAALLLMDPRPGAGATPQGGLGRLLLDQDDPAHGGLMSALRRASAPVFRERCWRWMGLENPPRSVLERFASARTVEEHAVVLALSHLALRPERARRLRVLGTAARVIPSPTTLVGLPEASRRGVLRMVEAGTGVAGPGSAALEPVLADRSPFVRLAGTRVADPRLQADFCFDAHPAVARSAMLAWSAAGQDGGPRPVRRESERVRQRLHGKLARSPHASVRRLAADERDRLDAWAWRSPAGRLAARRWLQSDGAGFIRELRERLTEGDWRARTDAVMLARRLGLSRSMVDLLVELSRLEAGAFERAERVAATAVAALGDLAGRGDAAVTRAVRRALTHADDRARANAVEAGPRWARSGRARGELLELKSDAHHRVRANALRALLTAGVSGRRAYEPVAAEELGAMLADVRPMHRLAGVWAAERLLCGRGRGRLGRWWEPLTRRVADLTDDGEPAVRSLARRCAQRVLTELRSGLASSDSVTDEADGPTLRLTFGEAGAA